MESKAIQKLASQSCAKPYLCKKPWPVDCDVQCGGGGVVFIRNPKKGQEPTYRTAFFEAFTLSPSTFIRGEGTTIEEAEASAWAKLQKYQACDHPEFERRNYRNGLGFCTQCGMSASKAFEPLEKCIVCQKATYYAQDTTEAKTGWYCEEHNDQRPLEDWEIEFHRETSLTKEEIEEGMETVLTALTNPVTALKPE